MIDDKTKLRDARRLITTLSLVCRQTAAYFDGISVLDQQKIKRNLKDAVRQSDRFLAS